MYRLHFTYPFTTFQYYKSNLVKTKISLLAMHHECMPVYTGTQYHATYYAPYEFSQIFIQMVSKILSVVILGANLIAEDHRGRQVAHFAAMRNHKKILQFLFDQGIDLDCRCEMGKTPVHYAAQYGGQFYCKHSKYEPK